MWWVCVTRRVSECVDVEGVESVSACVVIVVCRDGPLSLSLLLRLSPPVANRSVVRAVSLARVPS